MANASRRLPSDHRSQIGGILFLASLLVFFLASLVLYAIYAASRRGDMETAVSLPKSLWVSTVCLLAISGLLHAATRSVRRDRRALTTTLLVAGAALACLFVGIQAVSMRGMLEGPAAVRGFGKGVIGMVAVLAFLHALHVIGGIASLGVVAVRSIQGRYDHERHWPVDFAAHYWHFLDGVWICMLAAFWGTTGGFGG